MPAKLFLESLESHMHIMLAYDDESIGRKIEFYFIKIGLDRNELSIYLTHDQVELVEIEMQSFGINVNYFKKKGILKVVKIKNFAEDSLNFLNNIQSYLQNILPDPKTSFRIVGRAIPNVGIDVAMAIQARWEKILHNSIFGNLNGSVLCTYDLSQIQANDQWMTWLSDLKDNHHGYIIYKNGKATFSKSNTV